MPQFDEFEIKMLEILQRDGRKPVSEIAQEIGLSNTPCARRFEALQEAGVIKGFSARIGRRAVGLMVEVFVQVRLVSHSEAGHTLRRSSGASRRLTLPPGGARLRRRIRATQHRRL